jgi:serine/threonine-protein kinase RsbW
VTHFQRIRLAARTANLGRCRQFVEGACRRAGLHREACLDLVLAVDEACSNIIEHGYRSAADGTIQLLFEGDDGEARVTIRDHGAPFDPREALLADLDAPWQRRRIGGLGWHLIRQAVDEVRYDHDAEGNRLTLVKRGRPEHHPTRSRG